jgi:hypothetical protein
MAGPKAARASATTATQQPASIRAPSALGIAGAFTGIAAFILGVTYAVGVGYVAADLRGAHLSARQTLPLIPLPSILGRGMAEMIWGALLFLSVVLTFALVSWVTMRPQHGGTSAARRRPQGPALTWPWLLYIALLSLAIGWFSDPFTTVQAAATITVGVLVGHYIAQDRNWAVVALRFRNKRTEGLDGELRSA